MIDPKELRIGNLVYYKYLRSAPDEWVYGEAVISGIHENGFQFKKITGNHSLVMDLKDFDPVPITPEWLERLGFKSDQFFDDTRPIFYLGDFYIDWDTLQPQDCGFEIAKIKIKYIHQLQNLYHALTGQELTVKELTPPL